MGLSVRFYQNASFTERSEIVRKIPASCKLIPLFERRRIFPGEISHFIAYRRLSTLTFLQQNQFLGGLHAWQWGVDKELQIGVLYHAQGGQL
jgi:hypothetical protein